MSYTLDTQEARKADQTGNRIQELGKYIGKFTQAEDVTAGTGTKGLGLRFESQGQIANLSLYTVKKDGTKIMGFQALMAIMTCMRLRGIEPKQGAVTRWDNSTRQEYSEQASTFPQLVGPEIGLLLETEDYLKQDGNKATRMVIAGVFQSSTELTASEILDKKTTPEQLGKIVARLRHRPLKAAQQQATRHHEAGGGAMPDDQFFGNDDSGTPF